MNIVIKNPFVVKIYENCKKNMNNTQEYWDYVFQYIIDLADKRPALKADLFVCYDKLTQDWKEEFGKCRKK